ncbi:MAG: DMT family transporter [Rhodoferax sp.]|nr:DMT family transporter [Rhodoferax sp.]
MQQRPSSAVGIGWALLAMACFAMLDTTTKWVAGYVPVLVAIAVRYCLQAVLTTATVLHQRGRSAWVTRHPGLHIVRAMLLLLTSLLAFVSLQHLPVGDFTAIVLLTPMVVTLAAAHMLREKVSGLRKALVAGGFLGTLLIVRPGSEGFQWALLVPLALVAMNSSFQLLTSHMTRTEDPMTIQLYTAWIGAAVSALALPWVWQPIGSAGLWLGLCFMAFTASIGHYFFTLAFKYAPASTLMPYSYAQIAFAVLAGWLVFSHVPDAQSWLGMVLIALCGAAGAWLLVVERRRAVAEAPKH